MTTTVILFLIIVLMISFRMTGRIGKEIFVSSIFHPAAHIACLRLQKPLAYPNNIHRLNQ